MSGRDDPIDPVALYRAVVDAIDEERFEVTAEPIGWRCEECDGRFSMGDPASTPAWRFDGTVENLVDSASYHLRADHPELVTTPTAKEPRRQRELDDPDVGIDL